MYETAKFPLAVRGDIYDNVVRILQGRLHTFMPLEYLGSYFARARMVHPHGPRFSETPMRTPFRILALLAVAAGVSCMTHTTPAAADTTVTLANCSSWSINNNVFTCTTSSSPPPSSNPPPASGGPTNCSVTLSTNALPSTGGAVTVTGACTGTAATSWSWTGGFMQGVTAAQGSGNVASTTTFTGTPYNGSTAGTPMSATVTVAAPAGGGGNVGEGISCPGFANTEVLALNWNTAGNTRGFSKSFGNNSALVVQFTTGSTFGGGWVSVAEYVDQKAERTAVLSDKPCDFGLQPTWGATPGSSIGVTVYFDVGGNNSGYYPGLRANTTYYLNVKNTSAFGASSCSSSCNVVVELAKP